MHREQDGKLVLLAITTGHAKLMLLQKATAKQFARTDSACCLCCQARLGKGCCQNSLMQAGCLTKVHCCLMVPEGACGPLETSAD